MLQNIRDKATGWIAYLIVGFITIPFLFWGIQSYLGVGGKANVATVNDSEISVQQFQRELQQQQRQLREMFGGKIPPELAEGMAMKQSVLASMIQREVLRQVTRENGWRVSDIAVAEAIKSTPQFQVNGQFSKQRYEQLLKTQRLSKPGYEAIVREGMQRDQLREVVDSTGFLTTADRRKFLQLEGQKRVIDYLVLDRNRFANEVNVDDAEIEEYYKKNSDRFLTPERVQLEYLILDRNELAKAVAVDDAEVKAAYERDRQLYRTPETRQASHILIKLAATASDEEKKAAAEKAQAAYKEASSGADFAALAKKYSDDILTRDSGGNLGKLSRGDMPREFEDALFSLKEGEISQPVKTAKGYEIIRLDKVEGGEQKPFEAVKDQIAADLRMQQVDSRFADLSDQLVTLTYENPESLAVAADDLGLEIRETDWITRKGGEGIAANPKVLAAAFSEEVLQNQQNSDLIELDDGSVVVVRMKEHKAAAPRPLEEVKTEIAKMLRDEKLAARAREMGESALKKLEGGAALATVAQELGAPLKTADVTRKSTGIAPELLRAAFTMPAVDGKPAFRGVPLRDGNYALVVVKKVTVPEIPDDKLKNNPELERLLAEYNDRYYQALYKAIESRQGIEVFSDQLQ